MIQPICHLCIWDVNQVKGYIEHEGHARIATIGTPLIDASEVVPGTVSVIDQQGEEQAYTKQIDAIISRSADDMDARVEILRHQWVVATYTDERGQRRVCGSISMPLGVSAAYRSGSWQLTLQGAAEGPNACLDG